MEQEPTIIESLIGVAIPDYVLWIALGAIVVVAIGIVFDYKQKYLQQSMDKMPLFFYKLDKQLFLYPVLLLNLLQYFSTYSTQHRYSREISLFLPFL